MWIVFPLSFALKQNIRGSRWREEQSKAKVMCHQLIGNVQFVYFRKTISISRLFYFCLLTYLGLFFSLLLLLFIIVLLFIFCDISAVMRWRTNRSLLKSVHYYITLLLCFFSHVLKPAFRLKKTSDHFALQLGVGCFEILMVWRKNVWCVSLYHDHNSKMSDFEMPVLKQTFFFHCTHSSLSFISY